VKRTHPHLLDDAELKSTLVGEAQLASRIHHTNVVSVLDVEEADGELYLVMEYIEGASLSELLLATRPARLPRDVVARILLDACAGLHGAHEAKDENGDPLEMVHRDVSPHNILVGVDGVSKVGDFGVAKAMRAAATATTGIKGKLGYMAPEYLEGGAATRKSDVFSLGVVAWEAFGARQLFGAKDDVAEARVEVKRGAPLLGTIDPELAPYEKVVAKALARDPGDRYTTAADFGAAIAAAARSAGGIAEPAVVGELVRRLAGERIDRRSETIRAQVATPADGVPAQPTLSLGGDVEARAETRTAVATSIEEPKKRRAGMIVALVVLALASVTTIAVFAIAPAKSTVGAPVAAVPPPPPSATTISAAEPSAAPTPSAPPPRASASGPARPFVPWVRPAANSGVAPNPYVRPKR
jgi:serine/threonine-protein kinase